MDNEHDSGNKSSQNPTNITCGGPKALEKNIETTNAINMPLYPQSILKKSSNAHVNSQANCVKEEPVVDYDIDEGKNADIIKRNKTASTTGKKKSPDASSSLLNEDTHLDRPQATPGILICPIVIPVTIFYIFFDSFLSFNMICCRVNCG